MQPIFETHAEQPRIAVLPPELANQIAAGEVVERPASVVKELVENSLDAGARRIDVECTDGGLGMIRVTDDGCGMLPEDARLSLLRHATSKLRAPEDLFAIRTMGFRGEALPSIAAVSRLTLTTRVRGALAACRLSLSEEHGEGPLIEREVGAQVGTQVEVRALLHNVPARLKFMKAPATEAGHVSEAVLRLALAFPEVHFSLRHNGRLILDLPPHRSLLERARAALRDRGRKGQAALYAAEGREGPIAVSASLGSPMEGSATPRGVYLFVNRRFIRDRSLLHAVIMGYGELLPKGRYPTLVLTVDLPSDQVDVNVHPQKLEVRFERSQEVYSAVRHVVRKAVLKAPWVFPARPAAPGGQAQPKDDLFGPDRLWSPPPALAVAREADPSYEYEPQAELPVLAAARAAAAPQVARETVPARRFFSDMAYLGQLYRTYLICLHDGELVLIDQHAAHERLAYERLRTAYAERAIPSQRLLFPVSLELPETRAALVLEHETDLAALGFEVRPFGGRSFALCAIPDVAEFGRGARGYQDPEQLLTSVLDELEVHGRSDLLQGRVDTILATVACHSVIRAGDLLDEERALALLRAMDEVEYCPHCPHGRPVLTRLGRPEIEKRFGRG